MSKLEVGLGINNAGFKTGLAESKAALAEFREEIGRSVVGAFAVGGLVEGARSAIEYGARIYDLGKRFAVSTTTLQQWGAVAEQSGSSLDSLAMGFNKLEISRSKALNGDQAMIKDFEALGVSVQDLKSMSAEEIMLKIGHGSMEASKLVAVLGRNALQLRDTLSGLADGSKQLGAAMSQDIVGSLKKADDEILKLQNRLTVLGGTLTGNLLAPALDRFLVGAKKVQMTLFGNADGTPLTPDQRDAEQLDFQKRWGIGTDEKSSTRSYQGAGDDAEGKGKDRVTLEERIGAIQEEAALKQMTAEQAIATLQQKQAEARAELAVLTDDDDRKKAEDDIVKAEQEIQHIREETDRASIEAGKKITREREEAATEAARMQEENAKRERQIAIDSEDDPQKKRKLLEDDADALKKKLADQMAAITKLQADPESSEEPIFAKRLEDMKRDAIATKEEILSITRDAKALDKPKEHGHAREGNDFDALSQSGIRSASVVYGPVDSQARQNAEHFKATAYYVQKIYEKDQGTNGVAQLIGSNF